MPNAPKTDHELLMTNHKKAKDSPIGLVLVGYYIHSEQLKDSIFAKSDHPSFPKTKDNLRYGSRKVERKTPFLQT